MSELQKKFGALLQMERERRGLALADLSSELKISESNLQSIEEGDPSGMPAELYYQLFAKSYAEFLGIDYAKTIEAIKEDLGELEQEPEIGTKTTGTKAEGDKTDKEETVENTESRRFFKRLIILGVIIIVAFAGFLAIYKLFLEGKDEENSDFSDKALTTGQQDTPTEADTALAKYVWGTPETGRPDSLTLSLTAREQSWATVLADGDTVLYQTLTPWREYVVGAQYRLLVSIGIPRVVETKLNGELLYLASAETGRISRVEINQVNKDEFSRTPPERPQATPKTAPTVSEKPRQSGDTATVDTVRQQNENDHGVEELLRDSAT